TKFYLISKNLKFYGDKPTKTLLFLTVFNRVGILRDILDVFADNGINLSKLESRPSREKNWDYYFFIEVEAPLKDPKLVQSLNIIETIPVDPIYEVGTDLFQTDPRSVDKVLRRWSGGRVIFSPQDQINPQVVPLPDPRAVREGSVYDLTEFPNSSMDLVLSH